MIGSFRLGSVAAAVRTAAAGGLDPLWSSVKLLAHFDGENDSATFLDSGPLGLTLSPSGAPLLKTAQKKYGTASLGALAVGHIAGSHASIAPGAGDFTIEVQVYWLSASTAAQRGPFQFFTPSAGPQASNANIACYVNNLGQWAFYIGNTSVNASILVALNQWHRVKIWRAGGVLHIYVNEALVYENAHTFDFTGGGFAIGTYYSSAFRFDGYIDEVRLTLAARPGSSLPGAPFPDS